MNEWLVQSWHNKEKYCWLTTKLLPWGGWCVCVCECGVCGGGGVWYLCHSLIQARIVMDSSLITIHIYWSPSPVMTILKMPTHLFFPILIGAIHPPIKSRIAQDDILTAPFASSLAPFLSISHDAAGGGGLRKPTSLESHLNTFLPPRHLTNMVQTPRMLISAYYIEFLTPQIDWIPHFQINERHNHPKVIVVLLIPVWQLLTSISLDNPHVQGSRGGWTKKGRLSVPSDKGLSVFLPRGCPKRSRPRILTA